MLNGDSHKLLRSKSEQRLEEDEGLKEVNNSKWDQGEEYFRQKKQLIAKVLRPWLEQRKQARRKKSKREISL